jgi:hypothetical protein
VPGVFLSLGDFGVDSGFHFSAHSIPHASFDQQINCSFPGHFGGFSAGALDNLIVG